MTQQKEKLKRSVSRRDFLRSSIPTALSVSIAPRWILGGPGFIPPSERVNIGGIGAGGMGGGDIHSMASHGARIVALCDVNEKQAAGTFSAFPAAKRYKDFRLMLEKEEKNIDAVTVGIPDHVHAPATMAAIRMGKHVYCEKPLTHTIHEARQVTAAAKEHKVATQMGNQGHASEGARLTNEWIRAGVIGDVRVVHVWTDRPGTYWKQGIDRPKETPPTPATLAWDLWLGPAPRRPYHATYLPVKWRAWWDFGTGALGDMGCHIIDHPYWALELDHPTSVESTTTFAGSSIGGRFNNETYPIAAVTTFEFPARGSRPPVTMIWHDGGLMPSTPAEMPPGRSLPSNGALYVGSKGALYHSSHGGMPNVLPVELMEEARAVPQTMPRSIGHHKEWLEACKGGTTPVSNFGYSGPMTEVVLLGNLAMRAPRRRLEWDPENMRVKNIPELNQYVHREYRKGWIL